MSGSGHTSAESADLAAQSYLDRDNKQTLVRCEEPVTKIEFESYEEPATKSDSDGKTKLDAEIPSTSRRKPRSKTESDDGQQRLSGQSVYGKNPRRRISDEEWRTYVKEDHHVPSRWSADASIFRVPKFLKDTKREAYVPQTVSLGPHHQGCTELAPMDCHKGRALRRMMKRSNIRMKIDPHDTVFADYATDAILSVEDKIRDIYEESIDCDANTLARMLCLDGCCILGVLRTLCGRPYERHDPIFGENKLAASNILKDIVMLENQIPGIVLLELLRLEHPGNGSVKRMLFDLLVEGARDLFIISDEYLMQRPACVEEFHHVLGFLHKVIVGQPYIHIIRPDQVEHRISIKSCIAHCLLFLQDKNTARSYGFESIPSAVELNNAGIKFRPCDRGISGIWFDRKSAIIYLPVVSVTYDAEVVFRNLIAFEMCRPSELNYVISYVNLMDDLIDSEKDVALLRSTGILTKLIGSDKGVADLFNGLCKDVGTVSKGNRFEDVKKYVNEHKRNKIRVQIAELVQDHFSSKWKTLATWAAILLLCLDIVQTIFTVRGPL